MTDDDVSARSRKELARAKNVVKGRNFGFAGGRKYYSSDPKWVLRREREQRLKELRQTEATSTVLRLLRTGDAAALRALDLDTLKQARLEPADFKRLLRALELR
jgi:hypothetical protein